MASSNAGPITILILRLFVFIFLLVSLIVLATDTATFPDPNNPPNNMKIHFKEFYAYRYVLSVAVIGFAYTLLQIPFAVLSLNSEKNLAGEGNTISQFFLHTDLVFTLLFATAVGAGFGYTVDAKSGFDKNARQVGGQDTSVASDIDKFFDLVQVSTGFLLMATVCMAAMTIMSIHTLKK